MAYVAVSRALVELGGIPTLRMAKAKAGPVITDNSNFIIDCDFGEIHDPVVLDTKLHLICGIVETGLFCNTVNGVYFGMEDGTVKTVFK
jgi:ribose 5-phosphate isomerase A